MGCNKCDLPQIKVTEKCGCSAQAVETPHFCENFCKREQPNETL
jgi:hypothetical protein